MRFALGDDAPATDPKPGCEISADLSDGAAITALQWTTSADGATYLVTGDARGRARLWRYAADDADGGAGFRFHPEREMAASASRDAVVALAVDRPDGRKGGGLLAIGRASGAVDVADVFPGVSNGVHGSVRASVAPVSGVAWCAFPDGDDGERRSALVATFADGHSATIVVEDGKLTVVRDEAPPEPPGTPWTVPVDFHAGLAASPSGLYLARAFAFATPAVLNASNAAVIAARSRRGAVVVEAARSFAGKRVTTADAEREVRFLLETATTRVDGASTWDVREATRAAGEAVTREMKRRANTSRVARAVTRALVRGEDGPGPGPGPGLGLACEGCGADGATGVACATCGILPRLRFTAGMGLESAMA